MARFKVSIVGAGNVGHFAASCIARLEIADVVLLDVFENVAKGKAQDISQSLAISGSGVSVVGTADYSLTRDSDVVVVTAGVPRKPGMSREDLLATNSQVVRQVVSSVMQYSKNPVLIVVSNPVDVMALVALKESKLPNGRVVGLSGVLDSARFKRFVADELNVPASSVSAMVIGGHGNDMVPLTSLATVDGVPLEKLLDPEQIRAVTVLTKHAGGEFLSLLNTSAWVAPGLAITKMVEAILLNKSEVIPASAFLEGEYGLSGFFTGVPCVLGRNGVEKIVELKLPLEEKKLFDESAEQIRRTVAEVGL